MQPLLPCPHFPTCIFHWENESVYECARQVRLGQGRLHRDGAARGSSSIARVSASVLHVCVTTIREACHRRGDQVYPALPYSVLHIPSAGTHTTTLPSPVEASAMQAGPSERGRSIVRAGSDLLTAAARSVRV